MHYYQFNIGDYAKATRHLSNVEDLAYRRIIDIYYDTEKPITTDIEKLSRLLNMRDNKQEVQNVLNDFFTKTEIGYVQKRIESDISGFREKADTARANGKKGGRPRKADSNPEESKGKTKKTQPVYLANPEETGLKANQEPITNNHKPITKNKDLSDESEYVCKDGKINFNSWPQAPDSDLIKEWKKIRAKKKHTWSQIAVDRIGKEIQLALSKKGYTVNECIEECVANSWSNFSHDWLPMKKANQPEKPTSNANRITQEMIKKMEEDQLKNGI